MRAGLLRLTWGRVQRHSPAQRPPEVQYLLKLTTQTIFLVASTAANAALDGEMGGMGGANTRPGPDQRPNPARTPTLHAVDSLDLANIVLLACNEI